MPEANGDFIPPEMNMAKENATQASDRFLDKRKGGLRKALGTFFRTAATEILTLGYWGIPIGLGFATFGALAAPIVGSAALIGSGAGLATAAIGAAAGAIGTRIGWAGARHAESSRQLFSAGKIAEGLGILMSPVIPYAYPMAKAFSIGATMFAQMKRP